MSDRLSMRQVLEIMLPILVEAIGADRVRAISNATRLRMGDGGTPAEWLTAMGIVVADLDDEPAERAFIRALDALKAA